MAFRSVCNMSQMLMSVGCWYVKCTCFLKLCPAGTTALRSWRPLQKMPMLSIAWSCTICRYLKHLSHPHSGPRMPSRRASQVTCTEAAAAWNTQTVPRSTLQMIPTMVACSNLEAILRRKAFRAAGRRKIPLRSSGWRCLRPESLVWHVVAE